MCILLLASWGGGEARAEPYHSDLRSRFERDFDKEEPKPGLYLEPRIESAVMLVGNINLAENKEDEVDVAGVEVTPGIYASYNGPRATGVLDYTFIGRKFEDSDYDDISHMLDANGNYALVPDWFYVGGQASYADTIVDPALGSNYGGSGLFAESNVAEVARASIAPRLTHQFKHMTVDASYSYGHVWYLDDQKAPDSVLFVGQNDDSTDQRALINIATNDTDRAASLKLFYEWQASDFEKSIPYRYERAGTELGFRLTQTIKFVADGGVESDLNEDTTDGGLDTTFWHAGFQWRPDSRTSLDARYGERFFGDSYSLSFSRETKYVTVQLSYIEDPDVETRRVGFDFDPGQIPVPDPNVDFSVFSSFPYVRKDAGASIIANGARTKLRLDAYDHKREFIKVFPPDERTTGVRFDGVRDLGSSFYLELDARYEDIKRGNRTTEVLDTLFFRDYDREATLRLNWEAYRNFTTSLEAGYLRRSGDRDYQGEWFAARFRYTF